MLVLGRHGHVDDAGGEGRRAECDLQDLRHARIDALRAAPRLKVGEAGAERVEAGHAAPLAAVPPDRALGFRAAVEADEGRDGLDVEPPRMLEGAVVNRVDAIREGRVVLGVDGEPRPARRNLAEHRLHQLAGRAVALGDDDEARAHGRGGSVVLGEGGEGILPQARHRHQPGLELASRAASHSAVSAPSRRKLIQYPAGVGGSWREPPATGSGRCGRQSRRRCAARPSRARRPVHPPSCRPR